MICYSGGCDDLNDPGDGCVVMTGNAPGETAFYICNEGFTLKGDRKQECEALDPENAQWSGDVAPTCVTDGTEPTSECT